MPGKAVTIAVGQTSAGDPGWMPVEVESVEVERVEEEEWWRVRVWAPV